MVEAGTGTGKSVAYLIPASLWALQNNTRVVISTNTINLQDQLVSKDIPDIITALNVPLRAAVLKGRSNYLCPRRFETMRRQGAESADEVRLIAKMLIWLADGGQGDRQEINLHAGERMGWERISAADDACTNDTCMRRAGGVCPFYRARQAAQNAHIIIVNHALLLADVATGNRVLPDYQYLIVDEAHHMESAVTNALSFRLTQSEVERTMRELGSASGGMLGRLLTTLQDTVNPGKYAEMNALAEQATTSAIYFQNSSRNFFVELDNFLAATREGREVGPYSQQVRILPATRTQPAWIEVENLWDEAHTSLHALRSYLEQMAKGLTDALEAGLEGVEDVYGDLSNLYRRLSEIDIQMEALVFKPDVNQVYWAETQSDGRRLSLNAAPLHIGPLMQEHVWHAKSSVILTSATLTTHGEFKYIQGRLYGQDADTVQLGSPFDYESSTLLYIPNNIPEPTDRWGHQRAVEQGLIQLCKATGGRALVLFTSYDQLKRTAQAITGPLAEQGIIVYEQGTGASATALLENFRSTEQAVLLGTRSFWEGVDIAGEALSVLAIVKLPFDVPSDPIIAARSETFENAFQEYTLPEAILRFRQGFGRLIRTKHDRGVVAIFDKRVLTKSYGKLFIESLPQCTLRIGPLQNLAQMAGQWLNY
jgi:DNA polymerase-3 subunit epsilon/ATP-dependent DNA helicase DinG